MALEPRNRQEDWYKEMIDAIGEGGGSGLPEVTSADNGKVLTVENGDWTADSNIFYVTFSYSGGMFHSDKTYAEISDAVASGREVLGIQGDYVYPYAKSSSGHTFLTLSPAPNQYLNGFLVSNTNVVTQISRQTLPTVTASDAWKVLAVDNSGVWGAQNPKFVVTLTPTEQDFSGTMDKTPQEITAAHEAGQEIVFNIVGYPNFDGVQINADWFSYVTGRTYCAACATLVDLVGDMQIGIFTADIADDKTYNTKIYPLTPAT